MRYRFSNRNEFHSGSFTLDYYTQALRRFLKYIAVNREVGRLKKVIIEPEEFNNDLVSLIFGESNRLTVRYKKVSELLDQFPYSGLDNNSFQGLETSSYYQYLYDNYRNEGWLERIRGRRNCLEKARRTILIRNWLVENDRSFEGLTAFLSGKSPEVSRKDFPICLELERDNGGSNSLVQLDGSHRRAAAYYLGKRAQESIVISYSELELFVSEVDSIDDSIYVERHWGKFDKFIKRIESAREMEARD